MGNKPTYDELAIAVRGYEEECKALKAHVERLRERLLYYVDYATYLSCDVIPKETGNVNYCGNFKAQETMLNDTPLDSLAHIKTQVKEETIERHKQIMDRNNEINAYWLISDTERRYANQPEAGTLPTAKDGE